MPSRQSDAVPPSNVRSDPWERLELTVPRSWKRELERLAEARALSVAALVRQLIRELILRRHEVAS